MEKLTRLACPTVGVVTNVGHAHIGFFKDIREIALEKTDVLRFMAPGGKAVVNADDREIAVALEGIEVDAVTFGIEGAADFRATDVTTTASGGMGFRVGSEMVRVKSRGIHNVYNALAAIATASLLGIEVARSGRRLEGFEPVRMRFVKCGGWILIDDTYNANPDSTRAALDLLAVQEGKRRILVLGEMLELGDRSAELHREIGRYAAGKGIDIVAGIGELTAEAVEAAKAAGMEDRQAIFFPGKHEAKAHLSDMLGEGDVVLIKGSRGAGLEEVCAFLRQTALEGKV
jgi:UDP-N-acetylmuramyl pentapeptide synthase